MLNKSQKFNRQRYIKAYLDMSDKDSPKVQLEFSKKPFTPEQFTHIFMGILESYTVGLLESNTSEQVYEHFNNVFGIFLSKLVSKDYIYEHDESHKQFKKTADEILSAPETESVKKETEDNRLAAYLLARDVLVKDAHMTEESADYLLGKRLGLVEPVYVEKSKGKSVEKSKEKTSDGKKITVQ